MAACQRHLQKERKISNPSPPKNLREFIDQAQQINELVEIHTEVDPYLEMAEIHRRVTEKSGPVIKYNTVKGADYKAVSNLFGTKQRVDLAFGRDPVETIGNLVEIAHNFNPSQLLKTAFNNLPTIKRLLKTGEKYTKKAPVLECVTPNPKLTKLGAITSWPLDGGPFLTLPLVFTSPPSAKPSNLGMYRIQIYDDSTTGLHTQIGKGGGYHLSEGKESKTKVPVSIFLGGPPSAILAAIAPLPENVPETLLASFVLGQKLKLTKTNYSSLPVFSEAEFALIGYCDPDELRPEGPFGDHYGYYSWTHDFPVFHCTHMANRKDAIFPFTVVGKPIQEDYHIGIYLQELLNPIIPLVMPGVEDLWSYAQTGFHSLTAAIIKERYHKESLSKAFRILGEGQLALTKFLLLTDHKVDLKDFKEVIQRVLERADFRSDVFLFNRTAMDTLDYAGGKLNKGSKGVIIGVGEKKRDLPASLSDQAISSLKTVVSDIEIFCPGVLCVQSPEGFEKSPKLGEKIANLKNIGEWPLVVICDDAKFSASNTDDFLWSVFTRFNPATDIYSSSNVSNAYHHEFMPPLVLDSRMKPHYPEEVEPDQQTVELVDKRWEEYFKDAPPKIKDILL